VYSTYDTPSPIGYGSPSHQQQQQGSSGAVLGRLSKSGATTSPTPAQTAWSLRQQPVSASESYQYSQLSPARSPNGPTYTQLSTGARATPVATPTYHTSTVPTNPGKHFEASESSREISVVTFLEKKSNLEKDFPAAFSM